jgi:signal transduction histidine kinase
MARLVRFQVDETDSVVVEVDDGDATSQVSGRDVIEDAAEDFTEKLGSVRKAVEATLRELGGTLKPETIKVSFGVKLSAEAGAVIAKTSVEGNLQVEMEWKCKSADRGSD